MMARVSVIMGVYNCKNPQLLKKSVDSIIKQTFTDWEFIICNDGSTDDTLQLLNEVAQSDSRIKVISYQQGRGAGVCPEPVHQGFHRRVYRSSG